MTTILVTILVAGVILIIAIGSYLCKIHLKDRKAFAKVHEFIEGKCTIEELRATFEELYGKNGR